MERIKVKYMSDKISRLEKISIGDWVDLRASEEVNIKAGDTALISLGVAMELPIGYEAYLAPRSSTAIKLGVIQTNSIGIIDNSYRGEWKMPVLAIRDTTIHVNDRVAQFRIMKNQEHIEFIEVEELSVSERNNGGFGSTGIN